MTWLTVGIETPASRATVLRVGLDATSSLFFDITITQKMPENVFEINPNEPFAQH
jgi:hypothetical protein